MTVVAHGPAPVPTENCTTPRPLQGESVAAAVEQVATELGATCLFETRDGRVVAHCVLGPLPDAAITAVLSRRSQPLQSAARRRRTIAVSRGGGVQELELAGWAGHAVTIPIVATGTPLGWLWVLPEAGHAASVEALVACTEDLALAVASSAVPAGSALVDCLLGQPGGHLPRRLREAPLLWVAAVQSRDGAAAAMVAGLLELALRDAGSPRNPPAIAAVRTSAYLVLGASTADAAVVVVDDLLARAELRLHAGLSDAAPGAGELSRARVQADEALAVSGVAGRTLTLAAARPAIVLRHLYRSLDALPELGRHPLTQLLDYDARHGGDLAPTLLTWLDAHGDRVLVARSLGIHTNTVAYRVGRACALLGLDLEDPTTRLELHLRLRAALLDRGDA